MPPPAPAAARPAPALAHAAAPPQAVPAAVPAVQPPPAAPPTVVPSPPPTLASARLVADAQLRVTEASDGSTAVFGVPRERALGQHVLDAIAGRAVLDAVLKCLSALPASGEHEERAVHEQSGRPVRVRVSRAGRDKPVTIEAQEE
jgi:hypothetical protein